MFRKYDDHKQTGFSSVEMMMPKKRLEKLRRTPEWAFYSEVFCRIDEEMFEVLYSDKPSRPNAPVNQILGAVILKEMKKWTWRELEHNLEFDIPGRCAIGLHDMSDEGPSLSTVFRFLGYIREYDAKKSEEKGYVGLLKQLFSSITEEAMSRTGISKDKIRIDSTCIDSNIQRYGRIQLLIEGIQRLWRILSKEDKEKHRELVQPYIKEDSGHFLYNLEEEDAPKSEQRLVTVYTGLYTMLKETYGKDPVFKEVYARIFHDQIEIDGGKIKLKEPSEIASDSLQSPDDTDATYRNKNGEKHRGHTAQITETVDTEKDLSLVTDVDVTANNKDDAKYLAEKIEEYVEKGAREIHADGGYGSEDVDKELAEHDATLYQSAVKGRKSKSPITIIKTETNTFELACPYQQVSTKKTKKRYVGKFDMDQCRECPHKANCPAGKNKGKHYFSTQDYQKQQRHNAFKELTDKEKNIRSGSERTMHEMYHDRKHGKKMRVRGHFSMMRDTVCRAIGVNFMRMMRWCVKNDWKLSPEGFFAPFFAISVIFLYSLRLLWWSTGVTRWRHTHILENYADGWCF